MNGKFLLLFVFILFLSQNSTGQLAPSEKSGGKETFTYSEGIRFCQIVDSISPYVLLKEAGMTDAGYPLHTLILDAEGTFAPKSGRQVLLINNAIHPGEPDGVEASLIFARDFATNAALRKKYFNTTIVIIPFYNIGGALNRNSHSRANQLGPDAYGFRGSSAYLDLNRDFIKADAAETFAFFEIFQYWKPQVFIDTHVSNGADYQYTMTLIHSQEEKYDAFMAAYIENNFVPAVYKNMKNRGQEMAPYVNLHHELPDSGITVFFETPRFSNGYTSLFDCVSLVAETHMLKPFSERVKSTRQLLDAVLETMDQYSPVPVILKDQQNRERHIREANYSFPVSWNTGNADSILFKGYTATYQTSEVTGLSRLYYDRKKPYSKFISYHHEWIPAQQAELPVAYIIPQGWTKVIKRLEANGSILERLEKDTSIRVTFYRVKDYKSSSRPYEGHYLHHAVELDTFSEIRPFYKGDVWIKPDAWNARFLLNTLEPACPDSYFSWNFFDAVLQQKEWFSDYVFEDLALEILAENDSLKTAFEAKKASDANFAKSSFEQLYYIYRHSVYYEPGHMLVPVYRVEKD